MSPLYSRLGIGVHSSRRARNMADEGGANAAGSARRVGGIAATLAYFAIYLPGVMKKKGNGRVSP